MYPAYMNVLILVLAFVSISCCSSFPFNSEDLPVEHGERTHLKRSVRHLRAAQLASSIGKRSIGQSLRCDHQLHYVDGNIIDNNDRIRQTD